MTASEIALRPPTFADVPAIVNLLQSAAESTGFPVSGTDEVERWFTSPTFDVAGNFRLAVTPAGELLASISSTWAASILHSCSTCGSRHARRSQAPRS